MTTTDLSTLTLQRDELDGIFAMEINDAIRLFSEEIPKISIFGLVFDEKDNYIREKREVSIEDFMDYGKTTYRNFFLTLKSNLGLPS